MTNSANESSKPSQTNVDDRDSHGHAFKRVSGPGPKDAGKGAAGTEALERLGAPPSTAADDDDSDGSSDSSGDNARP